MKHKIWLAKGTCNRCNRYSEGIGADKEDSKLRLCHEHGYEYHHGFEGEVRYIEIDIED